jgi:4-alpha-glucanotransferase
MNPKKSNKLYPEVSEELNLPSELVEDLIQFYYKEVRSNLTGLTHPRINIDGLGQFVAKPGLVRKSIPRYKKILESHDTSTFSAYYNKKMLEEKVECLEKLDQMINLEEKRKEETQKLKDEYIKGNLEKPEQDPRRD